MSDSEQYDTEIVLYRCTECGETETSIGALHAHVEKHRGWHGLQLPWKYGDFDALMEYIEVLRVTEIEETTLDEVTVTQ